MKIPFTLLGLLHNRLGGVEQGSVNEVLLFLLLHLHDDAPSVVCGTHHVEDDASLFLLVTCLFRLEKLHVLDYKLALKYAVEERYQTLLGVVTAEDAFERPIDTWVDVFRHIFKI